MIYPPYWPRVGWQIGWGKPADAQADDLDSPWIAIEESLADISDPAKYDSANLPGGSAMYQAIEGYIGATLLHGPYTSQTREKTRMVYAQSQVQNHPNPAFRASAFHRSREGRIGGPKAPASGAVQIDKIKVIRNIVLWKRYWDTRRQFYFTIFETHPLSGVRWSYRDNGGGDVKLPVIDQEIGEVLLFHGTSKDVLRMISTGGFRPDLCKNKGTAESPNFGALGQGTYFSDSFSKVMTYINCRKCGAYRCDCVSKSGNPVKRCVFLSRAILGLPALNPALGSGEFDEPRRQDLSSLGGTGRHSVYAKGFKIGDVKFHSGSNEFVIKNAQQIYPEFVVYYHHA